MARDTHKAHVVLTMDGKQADKMLDNLRDKSEALRDEIRQVNNQRITTGLSGEEAKRFDTLNKELRETRRLYRELAAQTRDVTDVINKISTAPIKAIKDAIRATEASMQRLDRSTAKYAEKKKQLSLLRAELAKINEEGGKNINTFNQIGQTAKRLASYVLVYAGFNELVAGMRKMYEMNVALSDQLSDIEKTTGIAGQELAELSNDINRIDTRTSVEELNNLAVAAGKIGIKGKENVLAFVDAGNKINVALGEDLGEDAIKNIAKLNDVLGITEKLGVEKALLSTGSAINELGQNSTASEAYLVDFAQRLGGIANQAKITMPQILALASASDQLGQNVEVSATAMNKVITTLVSKTGQVAKAIGVSQKELQDALDVSTWEGLMLVLEKLSGKGGLAAIAPLMGDLGSDGARLTAVIASLSSNTEVLRREVELSNKAFTEATSIEAEYEKKNNNLAGTIEKIGKNIRRWFLGSGIVDWMQGAASGIERLTRGVGSVEEKFNDSVKTVRDLTRNISPLLDEYDKLKDSTAADEQQRLKEIMQQIGTAIPQAVTEMDKYGNVLSVNTDRARAFVESQKLIMQQNNKTLITETEKEIKQLEKQYKKVSDIVKQAGEKGSFTESTVIQTSTFGTSQTITSEITDPKRIAEAQAQMKELNAELERQRGILSELTGDYLNADLEKLKKMQEKQKEAVEGGAGTPTETDKERKKRLQAALAAVDAYINQEKTKLIQARVNRDKFRDEEISTEQKYNEMLEKIEFEGLEKKLAVAGLDKEKRAEIEQRFYELKLRLFNKSESDTKAYLDKLDKLYDDFDLKGVSRDQRELVRIQQKYKDAELLLEDALKKQFISQEEYEKQIGILRQKGQEAEANYYKDKGAKDAADQIKKLNQLQAEAELAASENRLNGIYTEQEYKARLLEIEIEYHNKRLAVSGLTEEQITELKRKNADRQISILDAASRKQEQIQNRYNEIIKGSLSGLGNAFGEMFGSGEDAMKSFGESMIDMTFDVLNQLVNIWTAEMAASAVKATYKATAESYATPDSVLTFGASGAARAAVMAGLISAALAVAKAAIKAAIKGGSSKSTSASTGQRVVKTGGFSVGGYSGDGGVYEVKGFVHGGEYIIPKWMMQNPAIFNMAQTLEYIRQSKSKANPLPSKGYAEGGGVETKIPLPVTGVDREMKEILVSTRDLLSYLKTNGVFTNFNISRFNEENNRLQASIKRGSRK